jgi:rRNA processing protein Krr1/Pno1
MEDLFPSSPPLEQSCQPLPVQDTSPTITSTPAKEYYIMSEIMQTVRNDDIVVNGIASSDSGRVVGRGGQNLDRIENQYDVKMTLNNGTLVISGGNAEKRLAAAGDVIDNLPVVIECPKLPLGDEIRIKTRHIKYYNHEYQVKICRPLDGKKNGTIWGRIENCRTVYDLLKKRFCKMSG